MRKADTEKINAEMQLEVNAEKINAEMQRQKALEVNAGRREKEKGKEKEKENAGSE